MKTLLALLVLLPMSVSFAKDSCTYTLNDLDGNVVSEVTSHSSDACRDAQDSCFNSQRLNNQQTECLSVSTKNRNWGDYRPGPTPPPHRPGHPGNRPGRPGPGNPPSRPNPGYPGPGYPGPGYPGPGYPGPGYPTPPRNYVCTADLVNVYGNIIRSYTEHAYDRYQACDRAMEMCHYELRRGNTTGRRCITRY